MGKITLTPGQLYLLREQDYLTGEISRYVKIGIVRNEKETEDRIKEHQTGNPRKIVDFRSLQSPFVEHLETLLHYRFAEQWITGEWFDLNDTGLKNVLHEAEKIISEQKQIDAILKKSYELEKIVSSTPLRSPLTHESDLAEKLKNKYLEISVAELKLDIKTHYLKNYLGNATGIEGILAVQLKQSSPTFNTKEFQVKYPHLHARYLCKQSDTVSGSFTLKGKKNIKKEFPDLVSEKDLLPELKIDINAVENKILSRTSEIEKIHHDYILLKKELMDMDWDYTRMEAELKVCVGDCEGITDICGWNRKSENKIELDKKQLKENHPEEFNSCLFEKPATYSFSVFPNRPYPVR